jgi:hypothetical protein
MTDNGVNDAYDKTGLQKKENMPIMKKAMTLAMKTNTNRDKDVDEVR